MLYQVGIGYKINSNPIWKAVKVQLFLLYGSWVEHQARCSWEFTSSPFWHGQHPGSQELHLLQNLSVGLGQIHFNVQFHKIRVLAGSAGHPHNRGWRMCESNIESSLSSYFTVGSVFSCYFTIDVQLLFLIPALSNPYH